MKPVIHIVAHGARTPVGLTAESAAAAVRAGISRVELQDDMIDRAGDPVRFARDPSLDVAVQGAERRASMLRSAITETLAKLNLRFLLPKTIDLFLVTSEPRPGWSVQDTRALEHQVAQLDLPGQGHLRVRGSSAGHAGVLDALNRAKTLFDSRKLDFCLIAGVDSYWNAQTIDVLEDGRRLATAENRSGFEPGEAAGCLALTSASMARRLGGSTWATVSGAGTSHERHLINGDDVNLGEGLTKALTKATRHLRLPDDGIDTVYGDINGERYRTEEWGFAVLRQPLLVRDPTQYIAPAKSWGDVGAASGVLFAIIAVESWRRGYARGPRALLFAGSDAGLRSAVTLETEC